MKTRKRLGEILVDAGLLTEDQLLKYIKEQRKSDLKLGEYLIQQGVVSERPTSHFTTTSVPLPQLQQIT